MIKVRRVQFKKFASFAESNLAYIKSHQEVNNLFTFRYVIPINIDQTLIGQLDGDLQIRAFASQKRRPAVSIKKSVATGGNLIKKIDQQRISQISSQNYIKKFFFQQYIDRPDLKLSQINFEIDVPGGKIDDTFFLEIAAIRQDGSTTTIDSVEINHQLSLERYDLPGDDFSISTTRDFFNNVYVAATTRSPVIGAFRFLLRKDSSTSFLRNNFSRSEEIPISKESISTAIFSLDENDQSHTVRVYPVSKFLSQEIGNFKEAKLQYVNNVKQIPIYLSRLTDSSVEITISQVDKSIKKVFLFRESLISGNKEFVASIDTFDRTSFYLQDTGRILQYPYVYYVEYIDASGVQILSPSYVLVPALRIDKLAKITVTRDRNVSSASQTPQSIGLQSSIVPSNQIQFNVEVSYNTFSFYDQIIEDVKSLGIENLVSQDLEKMTNNLKPITRVLVSRISLVTGEETGIGVFQPGKINITNDAPEDPCIFRFEVSIRSVAESLEMMTSGQQVLSNNAGNLRSSADLVSKLIGNRSKTLSSNFSAKFFTKNSLFDSTLKYGSTLSLEDLSYYSGRTGVFSDYRIDANSFSKISIQNIRVVRTSHGNYITWTASGDLSTIDQFLITADDRVYFCNPSRVSKQIFFVGDYSPKTISISTEGYENQETKPTRVAEIRT